MTVHILQIGQYFVFFILSHLVATAMSRILLLPGCRFRTVSNMICPIFLTLHKASLSYIKREPRNTMPLTYVSLSDMPNSLNFDHIQVPNISRLYEDYSGTSRFGP